MREKTASAKRKWIWIAAAAAAVIVLAVLAIVFFGAKGGDAPAPAEELPAEALLDESAYVIGWNIDRETYIGQSESGLSSRKKDEAGFYHIWFAVDGAQVEYRTDDGKLLNRIDQMTLMGLQVDESGVITDARPVEEVSGGYAADRFYINMISDNTVLCNSSLTMEGMAVTLQLSENTKIYDVSDVAANVGAPAELAEKDRIIAVQDRAGAVTQVFILSHNGETTIYWNVTRMWNYELERSTREPDLAGEYSFELAVNGELVTLKAKSAAIADAVDGFAARCFGLTVEDGYITGVQTAYEVTGGYSFGSWWEVVKVEGDLLYEQDLTVEESKRAPMMSCTVAEDCKIFDVSGMVNPVGTPLMLGELGKNWTTHSLLNKDGEICYIFVVKRLAVSDIYWSLERRFDDATKETARTPDADGWYYFDVVYDGGKAATYKTDDRALASQIDSYAARCFGLSLDGDVITAAYFPTDVLGGASFGSWYYVTAIDGGEVTAMRPADSTAADAGTVVTAKMAEGCRVYNVTKYASATGEDTELRVGDQIHGLRDLTGEIAYLFVVGGRNPQSEIYWNLERMWNDAEKRSTREPDADGWYSFELCYGGGKQVTYRTQSRALADKLDGFGARCFGLSLNGTTILDAYTTYELIGSTLCSWYTVTELKADGAVVTEYRGTGTGDHAPVTFYPAADCKIYDVSDGWVNMPGEVTELRVGDKIHAIGDRSGQAKLIYVVDNRTASLTAWCAHCDETVEWTSWSGKAITQSGHYFLHGNVTTTGQIAIGFKDAETGEVSTLDVALNLNGRTLRSQSRNFLVWYDSKLSIMDTSAEETEKQGRLTAKGTKPVDGAAAHTGNILLAAGGTLDVYGGTLELAQQHNPILGAANVNVTSGTTFNLYGGRLRGGDLTVQGLDETYAGSVNVTGTFNMTGGEIAGGKAASANNLLIGSGGSFHMSGGTVVGGVLALPGAGVRLSGAPVIFGADTNLEITSGVLISVDKLTDGAQIGVTAAGVFSDGTPGSPDDAYLKYFTLDHPGKDVQLLCMSGALTVLTPDAVLGCECGGTAKGKFDHTCVAVAWSKYSGTTLPTASGNYILQNDLKDVPAAVLAGGRTVRIDLNGHTITGKAGAARLYQVNTNATLILCDSSKGQKGKLAAPSGANPDTGWGGVIFANGGNVRLYGGMLDASRYETRDWRGGGAVTLYSGAEFKMYGGTIRGGTCAYSESEGYYGKGGAVSIASGCTFRLYGGKVCEGADRTADPSGRTYGGGNFFVQGTLEMYGGSIESGYSAQGVGGNVCLFGSSAVFKMTGGTIRGGDARRGTNVMVQSGTRLDLSGGEIVGGVSVVTGGRLKLSGAPVIAGLDVNLELESGVLAELGTMRPGARIGVSATGTFTTQNPSAESYKQYFFVDDTSHDRKIVAIDNALVISDDRLLLACECGGTAKGKRDHTCAVVDWMKYEDTAFPTESGNYILQNDLTDVEAVTLDSGKVIRLDLNGHTITGKSGETRLLTLNAGSRVTICDSSAAHGGSLIAPQNSTPDTNWGGIAWLNGGSMTLYSGTLDASAYVCADWHGGAALSLIYGGELDLYGGTIRGGTVQYSASKGYYGKGGSVNAASGCKVRMYGGTIEGGRDEAMNGSVVYGGGNVYLNGTFDQYGGTIKDGVSTTGKGGNVYVQGGTFTLHDGTISGGNAANHGGSVSVERSTDGKTGGTFRMEGGTIRGGSTALNGGNVHIGRDSTLVMRGGTIEGGSANNKLTSNLFIVNGTLDLRGGEIRGGVGVTQTDGTARVALTGSPKITANAGGTGLHLFAATDRPVTATSLGSGADILVSMDKNGVFTDVSDGSSDADYRTRFHDASGRTALADETGALVLLSGTEHCACGDRFKLGDSYYSLSAGCAVDEDDHSGCKYDEDTGVGCDGTIHTWSPLSTYPAATTSGYYYLTGNIQGWGPTAAGQELHLDLNGYTMTSQGNNAYALTGGTLTICDSSAAQSGRIAASANPGGTPAGGCISVNEGGTLILYGGTLDGSRYTTSHTRGGGAVFIGWGQSCGYMFGGTILGGTSEGSGRGGAVSLSTNARFYLYDGEITGGRDTSANGGGNVYVGSGCELVMNGGTISGGSASAAHGGNVYAAGKLTLNGGEITGGRCTADGKFGGNVYVGSTGTLEVTGGTISGGSAKDGSKANVATWNGTLEIRGGEVNGVALMGPNTALSLRGAPVIGGSGLYIFASATKPISVDALTEGASITVNMENQGVFSDGTAEDTDGDYARYFHAAVSGYEIVTEGGALKLEQPEAGEDENEGA